MAEAQDAAVTDALVVEEEEAAEEEEDAVEDADVEVTTVGAMTGLILRWNNALSFSRNATVPEEVQPRDRREETSPWLRSNVLSLRRIQTVRMKRRRRTKLLLPMLVQHLVGATRPARVAEARDAVADASDPVIYRL